MIDGDIPNIERKIDVELRDGESFVRLVVDDKLDDFVLSVDDVVDIGGCFVAFHRACLPHSTRSNARSITTDFGANSTQDQILGSFGYYLGLVVTTLNDVPIKPIPN